MVLPGQITVPKLVSAPPVPELPRVTTLETVSVPPEATLKVPALTSPETQFITALLATVSSTFSVPKPRLAVPCSVLAPAHGPTEKEPLGVLTVPNVLKVQLKLVAPEPPVF